MFFFIAEEIDKTLLLHIRLAQESFQLSQYNIVFNVLQIFITNWFDIAFFVNWNTCKDSLLIKNDPIK